MCRRITSITVRVRVRGRVGVRVRVRVGVGVRVRVGVRVGGRIRMNARVRVRPPHHPTRTRITKPEPAP